MALWIHYTGPAGLLSTKPPSPLVRLIELCTHHRSWWIPSSPGGNGFYLQSSHLLHLPALRIEIRTPTRPPSTLTPRCVFLRRHPGQTGTGCFRQGEDWKVRSMLYVAFRQLRAREEEAGETHLLSYPFPIRVALHLLSFLPPRLFSRSEKCDLRLLVSKAHSRKWGPLVSRIHFTIEWSVSLHGCCSECTANGLFSTGIDRLNPDCHHEALAAACVHRCSQRR